METLIESPARLQDRPAFFTRKLLGALLLIGLGAFLIYCAAIGNGPDYGMTFSRDVDSKRSMKELAVELDDLPRWTDWFHLLERAERVDGGKGLAEGAILKLSLNPKRGLHGGRFAIIARVEHYVPGREIGLKVLDETSGKLLRLFSHLEWQVAFSQGPGSGKVMIHGSETARTSSWRSRLFGNLSRRILLNQVYYPDLLKLADPQQAALQKLGEEQ